jgi:hypothetical protein
MSTIETTATEQPDFLPPDEMAARLGFKRSWLAKYTPALRSWGAQRAGKRWHVETTRKAALLMAEADMTAKRKR